MNPAQALKNLYEEYPQLADTNARVAKQFVAADGRVYNNFLIKSDMPGFERFIAKSFVHNPDSLRREWMLLRMLQEHKAHAPRLLIEDHELEYFLLMEYIDGIPASKALKRGYDAAKIFRGIGEATGVTNSIELPTFGNILEPTNISWKDFVTKRLTDKQQSVAPLLGDDLAAKAASAIKETEHILDVESQGKPILLHHDIYLENFLVKNSTGEIILIDYGIAYGGRPLFDLAKFFIWDLCHYPEQKDTFIEAYGRYVDIPSNFAEIMRFYLIYECFGMIAYFEKINALKDRDGTIATLKDLIYDTGPVASLLR